MRRLLLIFLTSASFYGAIAQNLENEVLFSVGNDKITAEEYMAVYNKNRNLGEDIDPKTPMEYLDLYLNFKLKVHEAKELGMDTIPAFLREFNSYRNQLTKPYLSDKDVTDELIREAYDRKGLDVRASHIMLAAPDESDDLTKEKALAKLKTLKQRIDAGEDFEKIAREHSADTYSAERGGDLGFFTVFGMVYPFECAAYSLKVGEVSEPIQTKFGYHLVKKTDERKARGEVVAAHILIIANEKSTPEQTKMAQRKINEIYKELQSGVVFEELVKRHSEDKNSVNKGGVIQPFGINKMFPEFEEATFSIKEIGGYSEPVQTPIGWHIIKLIERKETLSFDKSKRTLKTRIDKDTRSQQSKESVMKRLKLEYKFKEFPKVKKETFGTISEALLKMSYTYKPSKIDDKVLFSFANKSFTVGQFLLYTDNTQSKSRKSNNLRKEIRKAYNKFVELKILAFEKTQLESKYPEFRMLAREYFEGILLFDLTEKRVWKKSVIDTVGLEAFFNMNRSRFMWDTRYDVQIVDAATKKIAKKAKKLLSKEQSVEAVVSALNVDSELNVKIEEGLFEEKNQEMMATYKPEVGTSKIIKHNSRYFVLIVKEKKVPENKSLDKAKGLVISEYQNHLEKEWIAQLKDKYDVTINQKVLEQVIALLEKED